eukprot:164285_1
MSWNLRMFVGCPYCNTAPMKWKNYSATHYDSHKNHPKWNTNCIEWISLNTGKRMQGKLKLSKTKEYVKQYENAHRHPPQQNTQPMPLETNIRVTNEATTSNTNHPMRIAQLIDESAAQNSEDTSLNVSLQHSETSINIDVISRFGKQLFSYVLSYMDIRALETVMTASVQSRKLGYE